MATTTSNVIDFPTIGQAINADDQGVYFAMNAKTGLVHSIFRLDFEKDWYLHQLQPTVDNAFGWHLMAAHTKDTLVSLTQQDLQYYFDRPEFAEPKGAWQVLKNSRYGFGKFTALAQEPTIRFALIPFLGNEMGAPVLITKADEETLLQAQQQLNMQLVSSV